jgi:solute carrier family 25 phosphate transporter 23/24/25/41
MSAAVSLHNLSYLGRDADSDLAQSGTDVLKPKQYGPRVLQLREMISQPVVAAFCAGGVAGAVSRTVVSPLERLKILFQIQSVGREEYKLSVGQGLMKMWREEGWRGFMRGNGTNCIRIVPYSAVQFGSYNFYKKVSIRSSQKCSDGLWFDFGDFYKY